MLTERPSQISIPIRVKTYDIDFANIVHNAVFIRWLEDLRTELMVDVYPIETMLADGLSPILTKTEVEYRRPVRFGDEVTGVMWVSNLSRVRWVVEAEIKVGEQVSTFARQQGYFADLKTLRPARMPDLLRKWWQEQSGAMTNPQ
jgi:acyl-CoA thioester hydrolase